MNFSERNNIIDLKVKLQVDSMDNALKISIWNTLLPKLKIFYADLYDDLLRDFFREPLPIEDSWESAYDLDGGKKKIENIFLLFQKLSWNKVYDFTEFILKCKFFSRKDSHIVKHLKELVGNINSILVRESSGYRLVNLNFVKIIDDIEIKEIELLINSDENISDVVIIHLSQSLELISNKTNPDYRNSIKESISAVEYYCRLITGENTLGDALNKLQKRGLHINGELKKSFEKLYHYTNSKDSGIRHALMESGNEPGFDEAKYMLIASCAFVNYLKSKSSLL